MALATGTGATADDPTSSYHAAPKKIAHFDRAAGHGVLPAVENGWKFELFLQDFLPRVEAGKLRVLTVERASEFAPVKNADGADSPAMAREMILAEHSKWLESRES